jgi:hypothetical protein
MQVKYCIDWRALWHICYFFFQIIHLKRKILPWQAA